MKTLGIDVSTKALGYAIINNGKLIDHGKLHFGNGDLHHRMHQSIDTISQFATKHTYDVLCIEEIPYVNSKSVFGNLSVFYGLSVGLLYKPKVILILPKPLIWQTFIGNALLTRDERANIFRGNPKHTKSWYAEQGRKFRKQRTMTWVNKNYNTSIIDDDIGDAVAIAHYGSQHYGQYL